MFLFLEPPLLSVSVCIINIKHWSIYSHVVVGQEGCWKKKVSQVFHIWTVFTIICHEKIRWPDILCFGYVFNKISSPPQIIFSSDHLWKQWTTYNHDTSLSSTWVVRCRIVRLRFWKRHTSLSRVHGEGMFRTLCVRYKIVLEIIWINFFILITRILSHHQVCWYAPTD